MELRHLRCFLAVAEELHFARAAEKLHVEQLPPFRSAIRCTTFLLPRIDHQPQVPVFVNGQRGVLERLGLTSTTNWRTPLQGACTSCVRHHALNSGDTRSSSSTSL